MGFDETDTFALAEIPGDSPMEMEKMEEFLKGEGLRRDRNLDYSCGIYDGNHELAAVGSCFKNTLRCLAVSKKYRGQGLMNRIVTHLMEVQVLRGNTRVFLYAKYESADSFRNLGFYEIAEASGTMVFMENKKQGFARYLEGLKADGPAGRQGGENRVAAVVMNANPFTLGHLYLAERAASENERLHLFMVSEDDSLIPFSVRKRLIMEGTRHLPNVTYHDSGPYLISSAVFPSYFQRDEADAVKSQGRLDAAVFIKIAGALGVNRRYIGEEPFSAMTGIYNEILMETLPKAGISCIQIPRIKRDGVPVSASLVRTIIRREAWRELEGLVPESTLAYLTSPEAEPVIRRLKEADCVVHH